MSTLDALERDLLSLQDEGSLKPNTAAIQAAMRRLAVVIDARDTQANERAACLKELRAAFADIITQTSGADYAAWMDRVTDA